jgi:hypothetical protein
MWRDDIPYLLSNSFDLIIGEILRVNLLAEGGSGLCGFSGGVGAFLHLVSLHLHLTAQLASFAVVLGLFVGFS